MYNSAFKRIPQNETRGNKLLCLTGSFPWLRNDVSCFMIISKITKLEYSTIQGNLVLSNELIKYRHSLWRRANARNVGFQTLYGGQFTLSTQLIILNYPVILFHRRSTAVSLETYPPVVFSRMTSPLKWYRYHHGSCGYHLLIHWQDKRVHLSRHMETSVDNHLWLTWYSLVETKQELGNLKDLRQKYIKVQFVNERLTQSSAEFVGEIRDLSAAVKRLEAQNAKQVKQIEDLTRKLEKVQKPGKSYSSRKNALNNSYWIK